jgi:hypothetical protein
VIWTMGSPARMRIAASMAFLLAAAVPAAAAGGILPPPPAAPLPVFATTGDSGELIQRVPIARKPGVRDRVAMRLDPTAFETIAAGDRLRVSGEVQISTTCVDPGQRCVGRSYEINPTLTARIVLSPSPKAGSGFLPLSESRTVLCKQRRPNRNHHCTIAIPNTETQISDLAALPCKPAACHVNLIVGAHHRSAKAGDVVVLGADQPDGSVEQDKGRLNLVQSHAAVPAPTVTSSEQLLNDSLPLSIDDSNKRRVVYSVPIPAPTAGEVLAFDTTFVSAINALRFNAFISSRVIVATGPDKARSTGKADVAIPFKGQATESNGFNCTLGPSGYANPCTSRKAGAVQFTETVTERDGAPKTLYLNVLAGAKPLLVEKGVEESDRVTLAAQPGGLTVARWSP